jgi:hypothetical protein
METTSRRLSQDMMGLHVLLTLKRYCWVMDKLWEKRVVLIPKLFLNVALGVVVRRPLTAWGILVPITPPRYQHRERIDEHRAVPGSGLAARSVGNCLR